MGVGWAPSLDRHRRRVTVLTAAALLFAAVFVLRVLVDDPAQPVTLLFAVPLAMIAVELGMRWGLAAAALAIGLFAFWDFTWADGTDHYVLDYVSRAAAFFVVGGMVGALADRVRSVTADSTRFFELSTDLLCIADSEGYFKRLNPAWEKTLGWTRKELQSRPFVEFTHPDDRERTEAEAAEMMSAGRNAVNFENRYACKDGSYRTLLWSAKPAPEEGLIYAVAKDITERKRAEELRREQEARTRQILDNAHDAFVSIDSQGVITAWNSSAEAIFGWSREESVGRVLAETIIPPEHREAHTRGLERFMATGEGPVLNKRIELSALRRDGEQFPVELTISPLADAGGQSFHAFIHDITERKLTEQAAEAAREEAERANRAKSEFLSRMSHELRTPLNSILGFAQLLELNELEPDHRESVEQILKGGRHLLELIDEVLDISRIETGTMSLSVEPVHLGSVLADTLSLIRPLADEAQVTLVADPSKLQDFYVMADQQRLKQVFLNLLSNAVKYNRAGGEIRVDCDRPSADRVRIAVSDSGRGMSEEQLKNLFSPFERLGAERTGIEGTGLGLALSKSLVEAMGGSIAVESDPGGGTAVSVELERGESDDKEWAESESPVVSSNGGSRRRRSVVYVEDNLSNVRVVERALERLPDVRLLPAMQGNLGVELARRHRPDLILLDLHLPDIAGEEVLKKLRADPATAEIPVVVVSADATSTQIKRLRAAGVTDYLTKPVDVQRLLEVVAETAG